MSYKLQRSFDCLVVWNPWDVTSNTMSDFGEDEYPNMICVEAGIVITPVTLNPNNTYEGTIVLQVLVLK